MKQTWRWFGPHDLVKIDDILQTGAQGIVSALHHIPSSQAWQIEQIEIRKNEIAHKADGTPSGLTWDVVESLPVSENIKKQKTGWRDDLANYKQSLENLAYCGIEVVCYNFMPVLDWTRTDLSWDLAHGGTCMRFDIIDFAIFDVHILNRKYSDGDYSKDVLDQAQTRYSKMDNATRKQLASNIICGLPGSTEPLTLSDLREHLQEYEQINAEVLRRHYIDFLEEVIPVAEALGIRMCCHPDDPPFSLLGLPRIMSTERDYTNILNSVNSPANGVTLCSGSLGARPDNDVPGMMKRLGDRVHFLHLRNVKSETDNLTGSFHESAHLDGNVDMVVLIKQIMSEEKRRRLSLRKDHCIPMRPDHGQDILDDQNRRTQPGYPLIGRLKGLAELRGIMSTIAHPDYELPI